MINLENFKSNLSKIDKMHYKEINIYYIGYITINKIDDCESIYRLIMQTDILKKIMEIYI